MQLAISIMAEMQYPEFRQKLIDLVREVVTQLPELRPEAKFLGEQLGDPKRNGGVRDLLADFSDSVSDFSDSVSVGDLVKRLYYFSKIANHAVSYGCTQKQFNQWKYDRDLTKAIEEAIGEEI